MTLHSLSQEGRIEPQEGSSTPDIDVQKLLKAGGTGSFLARMPDIIPFLDPDSTRYLEWMAAYRMQHDLDSFSATFTFAEEFCTKSNKYYKSVEEVIDRYRKQPGKFSWHYLSHDTFRGYRINDQGLPDFYVIIGPVSATRNIVVAFGDEAEVKEMINHYKSTYQVPQSIDISRLTGFGGDGAPIVRTQKLEEHAIKLANDSFYPYFDRSIDELAQEYKESDASILLLIGSWGTGKSTFLRTLFFKMGYKKVAAVNNEVALMNPNLSAWIEGLDDNSFVFMEDADNIIGKRKDNNHQMSMLLNFTNGVLPTSSKLVISTNLPSVKDVDEALIRAGRSFDTLKFQSLRGYQINDARRSINLADIEVHDSTEMSLAEALNFKDQKDLDRRQAIGIGFR